LQADGSIEREVLAPAWKLQTTDGREVSSGEFAGKVVLLNFWATWCPPCVAEIPGFITLQKKYQGDLAVVGISVDQGGVELVKKFIDAKQINYPVLMTDDTVVAAFGGFDAIPVTFLIDRQGRIRHKQIGQWQEAEVEAALQPLLPNGR
jgi:peroxiredoxin